jgi:hypothetical protein
MMMGGGGMMYTPASRGGAHGHGHGGMDIDGMDYDQLLALQERLGHVRPANQQASSEQIDQLPTHKFTKPQPRASPPAAAAGVTESKRSPAAATPSSTPSATSAASGSGSGNEDNKSCCICMSDFEDGDEVRSLPCFHYFHKDEIDKWLATNAICPVCRVPIDGQVTPFPLLHCLSRVVIYMSH